MSLKPSPSASQVVTTTLSAASLVSPSESRCSAVSSSPTRMDPGVGVMVQAVPVAVTVPTKVSGWPFVSAGSSTE